MSIFSTSHVIKALYSISPSPDLALWHSFSGEGNNKVNTVMLTHFPACKWAHIKNSILRRAFYGALDAFIQMRWEKDGDMTK